MKRTVAEFMKEQKLNHFAQVHPDDEIIDVVKTLACTHEGAALVIENGIVCGIFSERDYLLLSAHNSPEELADLPLRAVMRREVVYVTPDYTLEQCLQIMVREKFRHLPVIDGNHTVAMLTLPQIAEVLTKDKDFMIDELVKYVSNSNWTEAQNLYTPAKKAEWRT